MKLYTSEECGYAGQLYISMQSCDGDLNEFFDQEMQSLQSSLSDLRALIFLNTKLKLKCLYYLINLQNLIAWSIFYQLKE